ncbi:MAG: uridine kinase [Cyanobacteria bacterium P01_H01_bin.121]
MQGATVMVFLDSVVNKIIHQQALSSQATACLVAISGIDGSGKGYVTHQLAELLAQQKLKIAVINIDGWLNLPAQRFSQTNPAQHFYHHAIRFDELFTQLIFPLRDRRSLELAFDYAEETATAYRKHTYQFEAVDVILLEGIYLLKRGFQAYYDLSIWLECSFATALKRAIARSQEGLSPAETIAAYQTIYFPAQRLHFERDQPQQAATAIIPNDG